MEYGELYIEPQRGDRNALTGRFIKGIIPHNKGKKWSDYMGKRAIRRAAKGWKNVMEHRPKHRPDNAGRCRKQVIAVMDDGTWKHLAYIGSAAKWIGGSRENVGRCCRFNASKRKNLKTGNINTDHKYKGVRFYFESDPIWMDKIHN